MDETKLIVVINGKGGVGKDTLCDFIAKRHRVMNVSAITKVKEIAKIAGWDGEKDEKGRKLLSDMKRAFVEYGDLPTKYLLENVNDFLNSEDEFLFVHIREVVEIKKFVTMVENVCPTVTLLVKRDTGVGCWGNKSDDEVENYHYDYIYNNDLPLEKAELDFVSFFEANIGPHYMERLMKIDKKHKDDPSYVPKVFIGVDAGKGPDYQVTNLTYAPSTAVFHDN